MALNSVYIITNELYLCVLSYEQSVTTKPIMMYHFVWLIWSSAFLLPWILLYMLFPQHRNVMWIASLVMMPFGLTEPIFVPKYWNPPSLFDLAQSTGFDIESFIFSFAIGGIAAVIYNIIMHKRIEMFSLTERHHKRHRWHQFAIVLPFALFPILYFLPWNPIHAGIAAMLLGAIATTLCRPDLRSNTLVGGILFLTFYSIFLLGLKWSVPGYIEQVWNFKALTGVRIYGLPLEELLFGFSFGLMWAGIYEHFTWNHSVTE